MKRSAIGVLVVLALIACGSSHSDSGDGNADGGADATTDGTITPTDGASDAKSMADAGPHDASLDHAPDSGNGEAVRAWIVLAPHDSAGLDTTIAGLYDPNSATFRQYLANADLLAQHAPTQGDVDAVTTWLATQGLTVARVATNRLVLEVHGTTVSFGAAFQTTLAHAVLGDNLFLFVSPPVIPTALASIIVSVVAPDAPAATGGPPVDTGTAKSTGPANPALSFLVNNIAGAYGATALYTGGTTGAGVTIGIVGTGGGRPTDLRSFWAGQAITRADPTIVTVADPPVTFSTEATLDLEWSGGLAPGANLVFYGAADNHDGSLLFAMNEAVGRGAVDIVSDSFSHHESVVPIDVRTAYEVIGRFAAATGVTLLAASGDSSMVDFPAASQWWTAVGGTVMTIAGDGTIATEVAWPQSGNGNSATEPAPIWQATAVPGANGKRAVVDLSAHAQSYFLYHDGAWQTSGGTSFASPTTAALIALVNSARIGAGMPRVGYLNSIIYNTPAVQAALHDVLTGTSGGNAAAAGWDYPTGWGSPNAAALATAIP